MGLALWPDPTGFKPSLRRLYLAHTAPRWRSPGARHDLASFPARPCRHRGRRRAVPRRGPRRGSCRPRRRVRQPWCAHLPDPAPDPDGTDAGAADPALDHAAAEPRRQPGGPTAGRGAAGAAGLLLRPRRLLRRADRGRPVRHAPGLRPVRRAGRPGLDHWPAAPGGAGRDPGPLRDPLLPAPQPARLCRRTRPDPALAARHGRPGLHAGRRGRDARHRQGPRAGADHPGRSRYLRARPGRGADGLWRATISAHSTGWRRPRSWASSQRSWPRTRSAGS